MASVNNTTFFYDYTECNNSSPTLSNLLPSDFEDEPIYDIHSLEHFGFNDTVNVIAYSTMSIGMYLFFIFIYLISPTALCTAS